ncbi:hypothetical protein CCO04_17865 [Pimelobacter sp. 30-1]|nr:hypothetical protein [Pimelobacter sp. 30-1]
MGAGMSAEPAVVPVAPAAPAVPGAAEVAGLIRRGELSAVEHVTQVLAAIDRAQAGTAAWAYVDHRGALAAAARADALRADGRPLGPLHGVAIGVKDVIAVAGMPLRAGSRATSEVPDATDAACVARLRAAGAVVVGKTTTHEFASGQGDPGTRSPHLPEHHPGGSSVGSAVAVAAGTVGAALATDTTGSIRTPAAAQGVVGFKPARGAVPTAGLLAFSPTLDVIGPIGRTVADCRVVHEALAGVPTGTGTGRPPRSRRPVLAVPDPDPARSADPDFRVALAHALADLAAAGVELVPCRAPSYAHGLTAALVLSLVEALPLHAARLAARGADYLPATRRLIAGGALLDADDLAAAHRAADRIRRELADLRASTGADAVVGLTLPGPQPLLAEAVTALTAPPEQGSLAAGIHHLSAANLTGAPAISLPIGTACGHPVGLHLLGLDDDRALLDLAATVERSLAPAGSTRR